MSNLKSTFSFFAKTAAIVLALNVAACDNSDKAAENQETTEAAAPATTEAAAPAAAEAAAPAAEAAAPAATTEKK